MLNYYHILSSDITSDGGMFRVALNADCEVYRGHFPGEPISPGVCNIQMIKECAELLLQGGADMPTMLLSHIKQCRLTTLVTPQQHSEVEVRVAILSRSEDTITFRGTIGKAEEVYMELKGELKG